MPRCLDVKTWNHLQSQVSVLGTLPDSTLGFCPVRMILRSPHHPQRPLKFARKLHPSKYAFGTENKCVRLTWGGDVKCFSGICSCIPSSKQSGALDPITHAPGSRPPASSTTPLSLPAPDSHREHDLHQGNSVNGLAHCTIPGLLNTLPLSYPQQPTYSFCSVCLSVCLLQRAEHKRQG